MLKKEKDSVIIVGCGRLGSTIAELLSKERKNITIIDKKKENFMNLSNNFSGFTIEGDAIEADTLIKAEIKKAKILLVITEDDNTNLMIAQMGKNIFNISQVVARVYDSEKELIYKNMGIDVISPTRLFAEKFKKISL
ncbi:MAG: potassium channel family protein [Fusobacteriaceae bacterium]